MCRNHSHLIGDFLGEDTSGGVPILTFLLANSRVAIEPQHKTGSTMILQTSGQLFVPSWVLGGSSLLARPATADVPMSLFLLPGEDMTTIREVMTACLNSLDHFMTTRNGTVPSLTVVNGATDEEDATPGMQQPPGAPGWSERTSDW